MKNFFKMTLFTIVVITATLMTVNFSELSKYLTKSKVSTTKISKSEVVLTEEQDNLLYFIVKEDMIDNISIDSILTQVSQVTATKLYVDYKSNEIKADELYRKKELRVLGTIASISRGIGEDYYLSLVTSNQFHSVRAHFEEKYRSVLADLHKGQEVDLYCIGDGFLIGSPVLKNCEFTKHFVQEILDNQIHESIVKAQSESRQMINGWLKRDLKIKMRDVISGFFKRAGNSEEFLEVFNELILIVSTPDNHNYLSYKNNTVTLEVPIKQIKLQYEKVAKPIYEKLAAENFNDITLEQYINLIKEERAKVLNH